MTRLPFVVALAAGLAVSAPARADEPFADMTPLDLAELGEARGGMMVNGIPMDFAVVIRTTVEGAVAQGLETVLTANDRGGLASAVTSPIGVTGGDASLTPNANGGMTLSLPTGTRIIHQVLADHIATIIANTQNDVALNQRTEINVDLPGFHSLSQTWYGNNRAAQMGVDAVMSGLGHR
jgi:hypothetical protein